MSAESLPHASHSSPDDAAKQAHSKAMKEAGQRNMLLGVFWCVVGGAVLFVGTYASGKISHIVGALALVVGGIQFLHGLFQASE